MVAAPPDRARSLLGATLKMARSGTLLMWWAAMSMRASERLAAALPGWAESDLRAGRIMSQAGKISGPRAENLL